MTAAAFELTTLPDAGVTVAEVRGEVDVTNAAAFGDALARLGPGPLIVDLSGAGYFDSAGYAVLARMLTSGRLTVVAPPGSIAHAALSLFGLTFHDSVSGARRWLQPH